MITLLIHVLIVLLVVGVVYGASPQSSRTFLACRRSFSRVAVAASANGRLPIRKIRASRSRVPQPDHRHRLLAVPRYAGSLPTCRAGTTRLCPASGVEQGPPTPCDRAARR